MNRNLKKSDMIVIAVVVIVCVLFIILSSILMPVPHSYIGSENLAQLSRAVKGRMVIFCIAMFILIFGASFISFIKFKINRVAAGYALIMALLVSAVSTFLFPMSVDVRLQCKVNGYKGTRFMKLISLARDIDADISEGKPLETEVSIGECGLDYREYEVNTGRSSRIEREYVFEFGDKQAEISINDFRELQDASLPETIKVRYYCRSGMMESAG